MEEEKERVAREGLGIANTVADAVAVNGGVKKDGGADYVESNPIADINAALSKEESVSSTTSDPVKLLVRIKPCYNCKTPVLWSSYSKTQWISLVGHCNTCIGDDAERLKTCYKCLVLCGAEEYSNRQWTLNVGVCNGCQVRKVGSAGDGLKSDDAVHSSVASGYVEVDDAPLDMRAKEPTTLSVAIKQSPGKDEPQTDAAEADGVQQEPDENEQSPPVKDAVPKDAIIISEEITFASGLTTIDETMSCKGKIPPKVNKVCSKCKEDVPKSSYTITQWRRKDDQRRCRKCVVQPVPKAT